MTREAQMLVCNRLTDMTKMHPQQDDTHKCSKCGYPVGIYPSGQKALKKWPKIKIMCMPCAMIDMQSTDINLPAASPEEILQEIRDSKPVVQQ
jgi:hypothetical protein